MVTSRFYTKSGWHTGVTRSSLPFSFFKRSSPSPPRDPLAPVLGLVSWLPAFSSFFPPTGLYTYSYLTFSFEAWPPHSCLSSPPVESSVTPGPPFLPPPVQMVLLLLRPPPTQLKDYDTCRFYDCTTISRPTTKTGQWLTSDSWMTYVSRSRGPVEEDVCERGRVGPNT